MKVYCDSKTTISIAHNPVHQNETKHVEVDKHYIKEKIESDEICMTYVPTKHVADIFTKGLHRSDFEIFVDKLGMMNIHQLEKECRKPIRLFVIVFSLGIWFFSCFISSYLFPCLVEEIIKIK